MEIQIKEENFKVIVKVNNGDSFHDIKNFLQTAFSEEEIDNESFPISIEVYSENELKKDVEHKNTAKEEEEIEEWEHFLNDIVGKKPTIPYTPKPTDIKENTNPYNGRRQPFIVTYLSKSPNDY